ncbi:MAG: nitroreductase family protein [Candidatus Bathyarchaeia archaeon]
MEFRDVIRKRYMVRAFKSKTVENEKLEELLNNAWKAPSAGFMQPCEFIVITDPTMKSRLSEAALDQDFITQAPFVIVVCSDTRRSASRYGGRGVNFYSIIDGAFASLNILLTAVDEGLGCCFVGAFHDEEVSRVLGLPKGVRPIGIIPVGYPDEAPVKLARIPLKRIVHHEKW